MCDCIKKVDATLAEHGGALGVGFGLSGNTLTARLLLQTRKLPGAGRKALPVVYCHFCPFCGERQGPASGPAPAPDAAAPRKAHPININDTVRVRLTAHGHAVLRRAHAERWGARATEHAERWGGGAGPYAFAPPAVDAEGFSPFQLWQLMSEFGAELGPTGPMPFESELRWQAPPDASAEAQK